MSSAAKLGVFMLVILGILAFFVLKIEDIDITHATGKRKVTAIFDNVAGLDAKSTVRIAGVRKGKVTRIDVLKDGRAKVELEVDDDVPLHTNATARVANLGLLGEKYIELDPGTPNAPENNAEHITLRGTEPASMDDITNQVSSIASDVKAITTSMRAVMSGPAGQQRLEDIVENVRQITTQVRLLIAANQSNVAATMANARIVSEQLKSEIPRLAASIDRMASSIGGTVNENRSDVHKVVENLRDLSKDLRTTADNLNTITGQMKSGEGTVGKLLFSNEAHDKLTSALSSVESGVTELKNTIGRATRIQMDLGIRGDYYAGLKADDRLDNIGSASRSEISLRLVPNPDNNRFYNIVMAQDPRGRRHDKVFETTVTNPATGESTITTTHETKFERNFVLSAQAGWKLGDFGVRLGVIDNTGGGGIDYQYNDRIRITGELFDFGTKAGRQPHLRAWTEYVVRKEKPHTPMLFVTSGVDNPFNDTAFTFGGGIRWRDDDLKYLLSSVPIK